MPSYYRILTLFGKSIDDNSLQCNCDVHPWDILINGGRWPGKIKLIGFIDVFFIISYTDISTFIKGIIVYKNEAIMEKILNDAGKTLKDCPLPVDREQDTVAEDEDLKHGIFSRTLTGSTLIDLDEGEKSPPNFYFKKERDDYSVRSVGHLIGLKTTYLPSSVKIYDIKIRKHKDPFVKKQVKLGIKQHDTLELIVDAMKLGFVASAEISGHALGHIAGGGLNEKATKKFVEGITASQRNASVNLAGDEV